jgi:hypothetical protein
MQTWEQARSSAAQAAGLAASVDHDFIFVPAAYHLLWFITVGVKGASFEHSEVQKLLSDIERSEARLVAWGMKERVLFDCAPKRYLMALKGEWAKHTGDSSGKGAGKAKDKDTGDKKGTKGKTKLADVVEEREQEAAAEQEPLPEGHLPVTDWRVFDQRFYGFYTWLEAPLQRDPLKCPQCERPCEKVHRCAFISCSSAHGTQVQ